MASLKEGPVLPSRTSSSSEQPCIADSLAAYSKQFCSAHARYTETWQLGDLEEAIAALQEALRILIPSEHQIQNGGHTPSQEGRLDLQSTRFHLAVLLGERYQQIGQGRTAPDLDRQVQLLRECADHSPDDLYLTCQLAAALRMHSGHEGHLDDATEAKTLLDALLLKCPLASAMHSRTLYELGRVHIRLYFSRMGAFADIEQAIKFLEDAQTMEAGSERDRFFILTWLGFAYETKHRRTDDISFLYKAERLHQQALECLPTDHRDRHIAIGPLSGCHVWLYEQTGNARYIEQAVDELRGVIYGRDVRSPSYPPLAKSLATALRMRYLHFGNVDDLDKGIQILQPFADPGSSWSPQAFAMSAGQLGVLLWDRYQALGLQDDSEEGIRLIRQCLVLRPPGDISRHTSLMNLAAHLGSRFQRTKDCQDIIAAIDAYREVIEDLEERGSNEFLRLSTSISLIEALQWYFELSRRPEVLQEALRLCQFWLDRSKVSIQRAAHGELIYTVAETYMCCYTSENRAHDLDFAIAQYKDSITCFPHDHYRKYKALVGLSVALRRRFSMKHNCQDVQDAQDVLSEALSTLPLGHTDRASLLFENAHLSLQHGSPSHSVDVALTHVCNALRDAHQAPQQRLANAQQVLEVIEAQEQQTFNDSTSSRQLLEVYSSTIELLPRVAYFGLDFTSRLRALSGSANLAVKAASYALRLAEPRIAIELLEEGRAVFWLQHLQLRGAFTGLPDDLASQLKMKAAMIEHSVPEVALSTDASGSDNSVSRLEIVAAEKRRLGKEFEDLIRQARSQPGYERFLSRDSFDVLSAAAAKGPVVLYLSDGAVSHAMVIDKTGTVKVLHLGHLSSHFVQELASDIGTAVKHRRLKIRERAFKIQNPKRGGRTTEQVLDIIWRRMVRPVVLALAFEEAAACTNRPRLTFCPTGAFVHLPLHAAATFAGDGFRVATSLTDYALPSYTPTIRALLEAQKKSQSVPIQSARTLLAAMSSPSRWAPLPCALEETKKVESVLRSRAPLEILSDSRTDGVVCNAPTVDSMLRKLPSTAVLHLACHGFQDPASPLDSGFILSDGTLTVRDLLKLRLDRPVLAFLSACETAKGDKSQPDQVLHLAAAMLFAGFPSVIGTMWSMDDVDGPEVASAVYEELFQPGLDMLDVERVPFALDLAVRKLRDKQLSASRWAPYVHYGA